MKTFMYEQVLAINNESLCVLAVELILGVTPLSTQLQ